MSELDIRELYAKHFSHSKGAVYHVFSPYRVCPIGAHVDHQYGLISGFAIDKGVDLSFQPTDNGEIRMFSEDFPGEIAFSIREDIPKRCGDWGDYVRGSAWALMQRHKLWRGIKGVVRGSLPIGGLSSSAAVVLCYLQALMQVNDIEVGAQELIDIALAAEKDYAGVNVGKLDQSCEVLSRKNHLLFLDTMDQSYEWIPNHPDMPPFEIVIFYSGLSRKLGSGFNTRVDELKAASWYLKALDGRELGTLLDSRLRDIPPEVYARLESQLPNPFRKRARHFFTECERVRKGAEAWRRGDIAAYGALSFESGESSIYNYETGSEHLIKLYEAIREAPGVYGGRFSGAGFKGCCMALIDPAKREECVEFVTDRYIAAFPNLNGAYSTHICETYDGVGVFLK